MRRLVKWCGTVVIAVVAGLASAVFLTARSGDTRLFPPGSGAPRVEIFVVSHGYHAGIVLPRAFVAELAGRRGHGALAALGARFADFRLIEIGWGEEEFYRNVPTVASLTVSLAMHALFAPGNRSVLHVVGFSHHPRQVFPSSDIVRLELSEAGFEALVEKVEAPFAHRDDSLMPEDLGPGLYGPSRFFRAAPAFHILHVCNHWVADMLDAAGVPTLPVLATLPPGLFLDLKWRSGLVPLSGRATDAPYLGQPAT